MKKYFKFRSQVWTIFMVILNLVISSIAAAVICIVINVCGGEPSQPVLLMLIAFIFLVRSFPAPRGALHANFTFGQTAKGTLGDTENPGGLRAYILWCPNYNITTHPALPAASSTTTNTQAVTRTGTYTMVSTKVFVTLTGLDDNFKYTSTKVSEKGGAGFKQMLELKFTGHADDILGFQRLTASIPGTLVCVTPEGTQYILGSDAYPCWVESSEYTTGAGMKELRSITIKAWCYSMAPVDKFAGTVPIS